MITSDTQLRTTQRIGFTTAQLCICLVGLVTSLFWYRDVNVRPRLPVLNDQPRDVRAEHNSPFAISDEQLEDVLYKLRPKFHRQPTKVNFVDHAVRLWGANATFEDDSFSGKQMQTMLLRHDAFARTWNNASPLLKRTADGIAVSTQEGRASVSHVDHLMGTLAEIGTPLSFPVSTTNGNGVVRDLLENALLKFRLNQPEYEWTALSAAFYARDGRAWFSTEGQLINFDLLANRIMRQQQPQGVCYGQHRLYTLTMLLRIDERMRLEEVNPSLLQRETRTRVTAYLLDMTRQLQKTQDVAGYWDGNWPDQSLPIPDPQTDVLSRRILATGHTLEWWAMAPKTLHPPRESIVRAAQWLTKTILEMDEFKVEKNYTFLTHAGRSLALWRGGFADDFSKTLLDTRNGEPIAKQ